MPVIWPAMWPAYIPCTADLLPAELIRLCCLELAGKGNGKTCDTSDACLQTNFCISRTIKLEVWSICLSAASRPPASEL